VIAIALTVLDFARKMTRTQWLIAALLALVVIVLSTCAVQKVQGHFDRNNAVTVNNRDRDLREDLSVKRQDKELEIVAARKELDDTLEKLPDAVPSNRRLARACLELRNDGYVALPPECGPYSR